MDIKQRLAQAHALDLRDSIEGGYDSEPLFLDAKLEIERLEGEHRVSDDFFAAATLMQAEIERLRLEAQRLRDEIKRLTERLEQAGHL